jgi:hypothetical protein
MMMGRWSSLAGRWFAPDRWRLGERWQDAKEWALPRRRVVVSSGGVLPGRLPVRDLVMTHDDGEDWSIGMSCPCGCGETIELMLLPEAKPRWTLSRDGRGRPTLSPSVWRKTGCRSHFWLREGRVFWCR